MLQVKYFPTIFKDERKNRKKMRSRTAIVSVKRTQKKDSLKIPQIPLSKKFNIDMKNLDANM